MRGMGALRLLLLPVLLFFTMRGALAVERWGDRFSYELCQSIAFGSSRAVVVMPSAVALFDFTSGEIRRLSTCNHLSTARPTSVSIDEIGGVLYIGHADGAVDAVRGDGSERVHSLRNILKSVSETAIRGLAVWDTYLYAIQGKRIVELQRTGGYPPVDQLHVWGSHEVLTPACLAVLNGSLYVGTDKGVVALQLPIAGGRSYSPLGDLKLPVVSLTVVAEGLLALCEDATRRVVYLWDGGDWVSVGVGQGEEPLSVARGSDGKGYCITAGRMLRYGNGQFASEVCQLPYAAVGGGVDSEGQPFVAFQTQSVQRYGHDGWKRLFDETPRFVAVYDAAAMGNAVVLTAGTEGKGRREPFQAYFEKEGRGYNIAVPGAINAAEIVVLNASSDHYLICSDGSGVYEFRGTTQVGHYDGSNSKLAAKDGATRVASGIALSDGSWWFYNASGEKPLVARDTRGHWHSFRWYGPRPDLPPSFAQDKSGAMWIGHSASPDVLRFDPAAFLASGGAKGLERKGEDRDAAIRRVKVAADDKLWVGYVNSGVVFATAASTLGGREAHFTTYMFRDPTVSWRMEKPLGEPPIAQLQVDHGSNIWIATARGGLAHLMSEQRSVRRLYNVDNSPLPSRFLSSLALTDGGILWVGSDRGAVCLETESSKAATDFSSVKIYPNPVRPGYEGWVTIDGLQEGTVVKVVDAGGTLARELYSNGGRAVWDGKNGLGEMVASGVYLLFLSDGEGKVTAVEKLVVVR